MQSEFFFIGPDLVGACPKDRLRQNDSGALTREKQKLDVVKSCLCHINMPQHIMHVFYMNTSAVFPSIAKLYNLPITEPNEMHDNQWEFGL